MMKNNYDDIIFHKYEKSKKYKHMSIEDRAAQFAPFAALTGHKEAVDETARLTDKKIILDENIKVEIDRTLQELCENLPNKIKLEYFVKDKNKSGGKYFTQVVHVKKIDEINHELIMVDRKRIKIDDIFKIEIIK